MEGWEVTMDITRAKEIVRILADGIDPITGEILPEESVYNSPEVIRALFALLEATSVSQENFQTRNAGKPWSDDEDNKLREEFAAKMKMSDIAKKHGRTYGAIESRLEKMGLKKKPFWVFKKKRTASVK